MVKAKIEFCGAHFVEKLNKKRKKYLHKYYKDANNKELIYWVDKIYAIRFGKPETMKTTMESYLAEARVLFNRGKKSNGTKGSLMRLCYKFWSFVMVNYINGKY